MVKTKTLGKWFITGFKGMAVSIVSAIIMLLAYYLVGMLGETLPAIGMLLFIVVFIAQIPVWGYIANRFWGWK
jgi:predicted membrane metal-binding protein